MIAIVYGKESDWVRNVGAAGGCELTTRGRRIRREGVRLVRDETRFPRYIRPIFGLLGVHEFTRLEAPRLRDETRSTDQRPVLDSTPADRQARS